MKDDGGRYGPRLLMALAFENEPEAVIFRDLREELDRIWPGRSQDITEVRWLIEALDQRAPDGWYFGLKDGGYGFWPVEGM